MMSGPAIVTEEEAGAPTGDPRSPQGALLIIPTPLPGRIRTTLDSDLASSSPVSLTFPPTSTATEDSTLGPIPSSLTTAG
jgi:hypothetical protein